MPAPRVSIVTAVYNPPRHAFEETVASVLGQTFQDWEWILTDDCSPHDWVRPRLRELAASDPRVRVVERAANGGIVAASNDSLALATGEFVALLDHDDVLERKAVATMMAAVDSADDPGLVDYLYSDQDRMSDDGRLHSPHYKPDWSPERFRHHMYTTHFSVLRRALVEEVGGFRPGFDGSQDHDLVLRVTEHARQVVHVPEVLYHWRQVEGSAATDPDAKPYAWDAGVRAVQDQLDRLGIPAVTSKGGRPGFYRVTREPDTVTSVSIVIPTIGSRGIVFGAWRSMVVETVRSVLEKTDHADLEVVVVYDPPTPPEVLEELKALPVDLTLVPFEEPFSFSAKCNVGAIHARGDVLVFLNDDMEARSEGVVEQLIAPLREPGVGMTGPKLLFEDLRIQHAGLVYGSGTIAHAHYRADPEASHPAELHMNREVSALTGACVAIRKELFWEAGGFSERLPLNYNDVDLSLKVRFLGHRLLWLHEVELFHFESVSRDNTVQPWELKWMQRRWGNLSSVRERYSTGVR
jgi:GT2 family glycosyltransferase